MIATRIICKMINPPAKAQTGIFNRFIDPPPPKIYESNAGADGNAMRNYSRRHYREFQEGPCPGRFLALGRVTCHPARCYWLDFRSRLKNRKPLAGIDECRDDWLRQHCRNYGPIILSQRSETSFGSHPCRVVSVTYEKNGCCHGRGRGFESRRPRHSFLSN